MNKEILNSILNKRAELTKLIFVVFLLALGTGLIVNYLTKIFDANISIILILGSLIVFIVFAYLIISILFDCKREISASGIVAIKNNKVISIDRYDFSERLSDTLNAIFIENEALKQSWELDFKIEDNSKDGETIVKNEKEIDAKEKAISYMSIVRVDKPENEIYKEKNSHKILKEAVEYIFIEKLSTHLSTYFNNYSDEDKILKEFTRTDFPNILLQNRIINLLSSPFEDRPIFLKAKMKKDVDGEIVAIMGSDGSRFSRFDLVLPRKSKVIRKNDGTLQIKSPKLTMEFTIKYGAFGATLPRGFEYNYLGIDSKKISSTHIDINLKISINPLSLLVNRGWKYYNWIDSFIMGFDKMISFEKFISRIDWEGTLTRIIATNQRQKVAYLQEKKMKEQEENKKLPPTSGHTP